MRRRTARLINLVRSILFSEHLTEPELETLPASPPRPLLERRGAVLWLMAASIPFYILLCLVVPPFDDEFYYWCWSENLQFSYYDHPGMVAYMIRLSTTIFGHSLLAIRMPCVLSSVVVLGVVTAISRPRNLIGYIFLGPTMLYAAVMITPDTPLLMFWSLYLLWLVKLHERLAVENAPPSLWYWVLGGAILGCTVLSKYTAGLAAIAGTLSFFLAGNWRRWFGGYVLHAFVSMLVASPILIYNAQRDFAPIRFQWDHVMDSTDPGITPFLEFIGVVLLLFGSVPFIVFGWSFYRWRQLVANPRLRVCLCLFVLPFGYFIYKSLKCRVEANWPFPCFLACWPLAAELYSRVIESRMWRRLTALAYALPLGTSAFIAIHAIHPIWFFPVENDRATRQWSKMDVARQAAEDLRRQGYTGDVYTSTYQWVALLRWQGIEARQVDASARPSHFTVRSSPPVEPAQRVFFIETPEQFPNPDKFTYGRYRLWRTYPLEVRGEAGPYFHLVDLSKPPSLPEGGK